MSQIDNTSITDLVKTAGADGIKMWSDARKFEFKKTFEERTLSSKYILARTAELVYQKATRKKFISAHHDKEIVKHSASSYYVDKVEHREWRRGGYTITEGSSGGRNLEDLNEIADARANTILSELPRLVDAVRIISPEIAQKIEKRDELLVKGQELTDALEPLLGTVDMDDLPETMTLGQFKTHLKTLESQKKAILRQLDEIGVEGRQLEDAINKALYSGLPGLSEAVIKVINDHYERITAFDTMNRRVGEKVLFGDSEAAMSILQTFEKDEVQVSESIKSEFVKAMDTLRLSATARKEDKKVAKKALKAKKE